MKQHERAPFAHALQRVRGVGQQQVILRHDARFQNEHLLPQAGSVECRENRVLSAVNCAVDRDGRAPGADFFAVRNRRNVDR